MRVAVVGLGFVGRANAFLLAQHNDVVAMDIQLERISLFCRELRNKLGRETGISIRTTMNIEEAVEDVGIVIISVGTNYIAGEKHYDTSNVEEVIREVLYFNRGATIVIKSMVPLDYAARMREKYRTNNIMYVPDNLQDIRYSEKSGTFSRQLVLA